MAKGNMFLGQARGKVGSIVFSRALGQQIARTRPSSVANPKTRAQNAQRAIFATVAKAASILTPIVDHSFANVTYGADSVRYFRKINLDVLRELHLDGDASGYNLTPKGGAVVPNSYIVSQGNLPAFEIAYSGDTYGFKMSNTSLSTPRATVSQFKAAFPYIQGGDQLTLVQLVLTSGTMQTASAKFALVYDRIVFTPTAFDDDDSVIIDDGEFVESKLDLTKTTNTSMLVAGTIGTQSMLISTRQNVYGAALILSREVNGVWQRSTQVMGLTHDSDVQDIDYAIDSYGASASETSDTEYLNQADESEGSAGLSAPYINVTYQIDDADPSTEKINAGEVGSASILQQTDVPVYISAQGFGGEGAIRQPFFTLYKDGVQRKVRTGSLDYTIIVNSENAGAWKVEAVFADSTEAVYTFNVSVQA